MTPGQWFVCVWIPGVVVGLLVMRILDIRAARPSDEKMAAVVIWPFFTALFAIAGALWSIDWVLRKMFAPRTPAPPRHDDRAGYRDPAVRP